VLGIRVSGFNKIPYNPIYLILFVLLSAVTAHADVTRLLSHAGVSAVRLRPFLIWFTHFVGKKAHLHQRLNHSQLTEEEEGGLEEEQRTLRELSPQIQ
jgi:hypothetical protein